MSQLTQERIDDLLFSARLGDLEDLQSFLDGKDNAEALLLEVKNEDDNTLLHYCSANGHLEVANYLLPFCTLPVLLSQNASGNTPLHWAGLNGHLEIVKALIDRIEAEEAAHPEQASKLNLLRHESKEQADRKLWDVRNKAGRGPMSEAQMNEKEQVVQYLLERMVEGPPSEPPQQEQTSELEDKTEQLKVADDA